MRMTAFRHVTVGLRALTSRWAPPLGSIYRADTCATADGGVRLRLAAHDQPVQQPPRGRPSA